MATKKADKTILWRTVLLMCACGVATFAVLTVKLYNIQIREHDKWEQKAVEQQTRDTEVAPTRGTIYDRNMEALALSANVETVFISPREVAGEEQARLIAKGLSEILGVDYDKIVEKTKKKNYYEIIKKKVEQEDADAVRKFKKDNDLKAIKFGSDTKRYYPLGNFASHVIGFTGSENQGQYGLEATYEEYLKGTPGRVITAKAQNGQDLSFQYEKYYDAKNGLGLVLTIDQTIQQFLEKQLEKAYIENKVENYVSGIVLDVKTGEILAMATKPDFDLNSPRTVTGMKELSKIEAAGTDEEKNKLLGEAQLAMWRNKPVVDAYEPGSTFKILTTSMGLEEKVVKLDDQFFCGGSVMVAGWPKPVRCHKKGGHGAETFLQGVQNSCNPVFIAVGLRIGAEKFYDYFRAFGLTEKTGIDLPGEAGSIYHSYKDFSRADITLAVYAFGQTFKITPIQLISAISSAANGGKMMKPHLVRELVDENGVVQKTFEPELVRQVISKETSDQVNEIMESVVKVGTGKNAYVNGYRIAGKTGTAEKIDLGASGEGKYVVSFVAYAPADDPQIAVLVLLDEPMGPPVNLRSGGFCAAPIVGAIMADTLPYLGIEPQYTAEELSAIDVLVPDLTSKTESEAKPILLDKKLKYKTVGEGDRITDQIPAPGAKIPATSEIILYKDAPKPTETVKVPNVSGMRPEAANKAIVNAGLYMKATGATATQAAGIIAMSQSVAPGAEVPRGTVVEISFLDATLKD